MNSIPHVHQKGGYFNWIKDIRYFGTKNYSCCCRSNSPFAWIRDADNMGKVHCVFKNIGYTSLISTDEFYQPMDVGVKEWKGLSPANVVDSLILTFKFPEQGSLYYREFWERRLAEGTKDTLGAILVEVKKSYEGTELNPEEMMSVSERQLYTLLGFDLQLQASEKTTSVLLQKYFDYLLTIGLQHSAYNLIMEEFPGVLSEEEVFKRLKLDTISESEYWNTRNDAAWICTYRDNGP